uniref:Protein kinase domain-containing protein n=1 Tax=Macrostomum lignano TaxID=282301 RepID=A0A1I8H1E7_9PLAT
MPGNGLATNQQPMLCSSPSLQLDLKQQQQQQLPLSHVEVEPSTEPEPSAAFPNSQLQLLSGAAIWPPSASSEVALEPSGKALLAVSGRCGMRLAEPLLAADWCADESEVVELGFLASGSQGSVTLVLHRGQQVALKRFNDPDAALLVPLKELSHLGRLSHPHVVGTDCLPAARIADWSRQLASGMAYLHECRIPHGDLKSPNILLCELDRLKISDFGLVPPNRGDEAGSGHRQQQQQQLYGTMRWMSPEQCRQEAWSYPADVYSYGVILWELLFMEVPYKCVDPWAVMLGVGQGSLCLPVPGHTPGLLGSLMQTCWSTEPSQRPTFRGIVTALAASGLPDLLVLTDGDLRVLRKVWSAEISRAMSSRVRREDFKAKLEADLLRRRRDELHHAADIRLLYEKRLRRLDELQMSLTNSQIRQQLRDRAEAQRSDRLREAVRDRCCRRCRRALRGLVGEGGDAVKEDNDSGDCRMADNCAKTSAAAASRGSGVVLDRPIRAAISLDCLAAAAAASASSAATEAAAATAAATNAAEEAESPSSPGRGIGDRGQPFRRAYRRRAPPAVAPQQQQTPPPPVPRPLASEGEPQLRPRPGRRSGASEASTSSASTSSPSTSMAAGSAQLRLSTDLLTQELQEHLAGDRLSECEARLGGLVSEAHSEAAASGHSDLDEQIDQLRNLSIETQRQRLTSDGFWKAVKSPSSFSAAATENCRICLQSKSEVSGSLCKFLWTLTCGNEPNALFHLECCCGVGTGGFMCFRCL